MQVLAFMRKKSWLPLKVRKRNATQKSKLRKRSAFAVKIGNKRKKRQKRKRWKKKQLERRKKPSRMSSQPQETSKCILGNTSLRKAIMRLV